MTMIYTSRLHWKLAVMTLLTYLTFMMMAMIISRESPRFPVEIRLYHLYYESITTSKEATHASRNMSFELPQSQRLIVSSAPQLPPLPPPPQTPLSSMPLFEQRLSQGQSRSLVNMDECQGFVLAREEFDKGNIDLSYSLLERLPSDFNQSLSNYNNSLAKYSNHLLDDILLLLPTSNGEAMESAEQYIRAVEYGKSRLQQRSMCKHYVFESFNFLHSHNDTNIKDWAESTFELANLRKWYYERNEDLPTIAGVGIYFIESEENSISSRWPNLQKSIRDHHHTAAKETKSNVTDASYERMERISFFISLALLDSDGSHITDVTVPMSVATGMSFFISDIQVDGLASPLPVNIPLAFNYYDIPNGFSDKGPTRYDLTTLNADITHFIDDVMRNSLSASSSPSKNTTISISRVTIEARRSIAHQSSEKIDVDVLATFDIKLCDFEAEETKTDVAISVIGELYDLSDVYMEEQTTQDNMKIKVYNFIEYHRHVHNVNRFYFYGYSNFTRSMLAHYIEKKIVIYTHFPYFIDAGGGDRSVGLRRVKNKFNNSSPLDVRLSVS